MPSSTLSSKNSITESAFTVFLFYYGDMDTSSWISELTDVLNDECYYLFEFTNLLDNYTFLVLSTEFIYDSLTMLLSENFLTESTVE